MKRLPTLEEYLENKEPAGELSICPNCGEKKACRTYWRGTEYCNEEMNYNYGCAECEQDEQSEWDERFKEYYSGRL
jgi:hypothetical protein